MKQHLAEVRKIADNPEPATFDNTIVAIEKSGETLGRIARVFFGLVQADTNDARQKIREEIAPKLAAHEDEINLRSEEHTSELQSLMRISYDGVCLKKQIKKKTE